MEIMNVKLISLGSVRLAYIALHQDYSSFQVSNTSLSEEQACRIVIRRCLNLGHWGVIEHIPVVLSCGYVPHSAVQQITRHRLFSFDVQSFRYTSDGIIEAAEGKRDVEEVIYLKAPGCYRNPRTSGSYTYTSEMRQVDKDFAIQLIKLYRDKVKQGIPPEHTRGMLPFDYRQHFIMSGNLRSFFHLFNLRLKQNVQHETFGLVNLMKVELLKSPVAPLVEWYLEKGVGKIAP